MTDSVSAVPFSNADARFMSRAISLAKTGQFTTSPNPNVGCVITSEQGDILAEGAHYQAGENHAEINALSQLGMVAKDCTVYVSLEPCSHYGRTPPCCDALIRAQVKRVVIAMVDPHERVAGRGIQRMRDAGIQVDVGLLSGEAEKLNQGFIKRHLTGRPKITLKLAASIDGKTALANGKSRWITGPSARRDVQVHRAKSCAIVSGSGTVLADNPSLNVRACELPDYAVKSYPGFSDHKDNIELIRQPLKVLLDGRGQLNPDLKVFSDDNTLVINKNHSRVLESRNIKQWQGPVVDGKIDLLAAMQHLGELQLNEIWLEAGARLAGAFVQAQLVDEFILYLAPKVMGDKGASLLELPELQSMSDVPELDILDTKMVGQDIKLTTRFRY